MTKRSAAQKNNTTKRRLTGARESNAGDDFHVLWTVRRALQLLNPASNLRRVVMEGLTPLDAPEEEEDHYLGVDLSEYFGGDDFDSSSRVNAAQLKYSTRHPDQAWTASKLATASFKDTPVIQRLANIYKGFLSKVQREDVLGKLSIQLVSNQPVADDLQAALSATKNSLLTKKSSWLTSQLLKQIPQQHHAIIKQLQSASGLLSGEFTDFLRILDLSHCGEESRVFQQLRVIQELGLVMTEGQLEGLRNLYDLVRHEAMPEAKSSTGLTAFDIRAALGVAHSEQILPAPSHLNSPEHPIITDDIRYLAAAVTEAPTKRVLAHGGAGVGKSTTIQQLREHLPHGSVVLIYDCFGQGGYLTPGQQRHLETRAFMQIINELAIQCGSHFLLQSPHSGPDLQRTLTKSLEKAAEIVAATPGALLVLIIDASDNAVIAARQYGDSCFVPVLWKISLDENCRIVMTSRSHRRGMLEAQDVREFQLSGFDEVASTVHIRTKFPDAGLEQGKQFHSQTVGNPRWQDYRLQTMPSTTHANADLVEFLSHPQGSLEKMFEDLWQSVLREKANHEQASQILAILMCLARPVSLQLFAETCGISLSDAELFSAALTPGVIVESGMLAFRDEDFETYLRDKVTEQRFREAHDRLANYFLARIASDEYAARFVVEHLANARRLEEIISLALNDPDAAIISNELLRLEVGRRRLTLALSAAAERSDFYSGLRLLILAAQSIRSNGAVTAIVRDNPELAAEFGDYETVAHLYFREKNNAWLGSAHFRIAALYARDSTQREAALRHLADADAWVRLFMIRQKENRLDWDINASDIAAGAEALFWLEGLKSAFDWLRSWRPRAFALDATEIFAKSIAVVLSEQEVNALLKDLRLPATYMARILTAVWRVNRIPAPGIVSQTAERIDKAIQRNGLSREGTKEWATEFCELAAASGIDSDRILRIIAAIAPPMPRTAPWPGSPPETYDSELRARCLQAVLSDQLLDLDAILPQEIRGQTYRHDSERRRFEESMGKLLGLFQSRAGAILNTLSASAVTEQITADLGKFLSESGYRWFRHNPLYPLWAKRACETLMHCTGNSADLMLQIADAAEAISRNAAPTVWLGLSELLIREAEYRSLALRLLARTAQFVLEKPLPGDERWQVLLQCAEYASRYDKVSAQEYYRMSLVAAAGLNDENALLLSLLSHISRVIVQEINPQERRRLASRLSRLAEGYAPFTSSKTVIQWEDVLATVTRLDLASGFALCSRWDDEEHLYVRTGIVELVREATATDLISPDQGIALLRLAGEQHDITEEVLPIFERLRAKGGAARPQLAQLTKAVSDWIARDVPLKIRPDAAKRILQWATANGLSQLPGLEELRNLVKFSTEAQTTTASESKPYRSGMDVEETLQELLASARAGSLENFDERLKGVWMNSGDSNAIRDYLHTLGKAVTASDREKVLKLIVATPVRSWYAESVVAGFNSCLIEWKTWQPIKSVVAPSIAQFLDNHLLTLLASDSTGGIVTTLLSAPQVAPQDRVILLLTAVTKQLDNLTSSMLYAAARALISSIPLSTLQQVLEKSIEAEEEKIKDGEQTLPALVHATTDDPATVLAQFIWSMCGHPDKYVRWRMIHSARAMSLHTNRALLARLVEASLTEGAGPYRSINLDFFWISARTWLLILFDRIAVDHPEAFVEHVHALTQHVLSPTLPHAQIREIGRRLLLRVLAYAPGALPQDIQAKVRRVNLAIEPDLQGNDGETENEPQITAPRVMRGKRKDGRFSFPFDVPEYWFANLDRVFGVGEDEISRRAETWIIDRWGFTDEDWRGDRRELGGRYERRIGGRLQGGAPVVETLHTYLAYHAMHCVAGDMISTLPVKSLSADSYPYTSWADWIKEYDLTEKDYWQSEQRSATPYKTDCWNLFHDYRRKLALISEQQCFDALGIDEIGHSGEMVVYGYHETDDLVQRSTTRVNTALVTPETALALMRALSSTSTYRYALPIHRHNYGDLEVMEPGFNLESWLSADGRYDEGVDEHDPLNRTKSAALIGFSAGFLSEMATTSIPSPRRYVLPNGAIIGRIEIWNDEYESYAFSHDHTTEPYSDGSRTWICIDKLLEYLRRREKDLIVAVEITRHRKERYSRGEGEGDERSRSAIYIIRRSGEIEGMAGSRPLGPAYSA